MYDDLSKVKSRIPNIVQSAVISFQDHKTKILSFLSYISICLSYYPHLRCSCSPCYVYMQISPHFYALIISNWETCIVLFSVRFVCLFVGVHGLSSQLDFYGTKATLFICHQS